MRFSSRLVTKLAKLRAGAPWSIGLVDKKNIKGDTRMLDKLKFWWQGKRVTPATLVMVAASCLALGLGVSPGIHPARPAVAEPLPARPAAGPHPRGFNQLHPGFLR